MKFLVLGHLCLDVIHGADDSESEGVGGIYYGLATLATLCDARDRIFPVFGVNRAEHKDLLADLARYPSIDPSGIFPFDEPTNRVHLYYREGGSRIECSKDISPPIPLEKFRRFLDVDAILLNMVSGSDITLETLDELRMAIRGEKIAVHFDFHSLTLAPANNYERRRRPVEEWRRWAFMMDTLQLNEEEIAGLPLEPMSEQQTAGHLLTLGVKGVLVTRGDRGVSVFRNEQKHVVKTDIPGIPAKKSGDVTGCGDVFGAAFLYRYAKTKDILASADFANRAAAAKVMIHGAGDLRQLRTEFETE